MQPSIELVTLGHAIVDVLAPSPDELVHELGLTKGTMTLVDDLQAESIYARLGPATEVSGGSAANTAAALASLGAAVSFVGKVADDELGRVFIHDIRAAGVTFSVPPQAGGPGTGRSLIMVTPDAEKTMCTNLGVGAQLQPDDLDEHDIAEARILYIEGYLYGDRETDGAVERAVSVARQSGTLVSLSLSDPSWVETHHAAMDRLLDSVDILFANEEEACGMAGAGDIEAALVALGRRCPTVAVTRGAGGSLVWRHGAVTAVPAAEVERVVDTTGAGDSYAAGFLYGVVRDLGTRPSARLGAMVAGEVVSHFGARPQMSLAELGATAAVEV
jgi:sugar/nucleoside kinase (ribokinase family)